MKITKPILVLIYSLLMAGSAFSQDDYKKAEFFVGYSRGQIQSELEDAGFLDNYTSFNGFNASVVVNVNRYIGIKGDVSGTYQNKSYSFNTIGGPITFDTDSSLYNFVGGVQIKDNAKKGVFKPFAHVMAGAGREKIRIRNFVCPVGVDCSFFNGSGGSETGLAGVFGGGIDLRLNDRVQIRAIQLDYNPIRPDGATQSNFRVGVGIVF